MNLLLQVVTLPPTFIKIMNCITFIVYRFVVILMCPCYTCIYCSNKISHNDMHLALNQTLILH